MNLRPIVCAIALAIAAPDACVRNSDDALVASAKHLTPAVVLLSMKVPPERKKDRYDDAYATGFVVASGGWGSDILTVQHAIDSAWDLAVTSENRRRTRARVMAANADLDLALVRTAQPNLPAIRLGSSHRLQAEVGREVALLGYPVPDEFDDEGLGMATSLNAGLLSSIRKDALEVTTSIVPGDSGAPMFFADTGEVFGVADSRFESEPSIGFAVPIDDAKAFLHRVDRSHGF
ncbi:MAG: trypsin-like peptidase domain-containing protein [Candidatus Eremiobacteraeota bacterium]|nr:trypsin-like peptidase domain-containing protein [Candidatus Eremiobacteraeota bacterium]